MIVLATKGNVFRAVIIAIPCIIADLFVATNIAGFVTQMAADVNFQMPAGSTGMVSSFLDGGNPFRFWVLKIFDGDVMALAFIPVIAVVVYGVYRMTKNVVYAEGSD